MNTNESQGEIRRCIDWIIVRSGTIERENKDLEMEEILFNYDSSREGSSCRTPTS